MFVHHARQHSTSEQGPGGHSRTRTVRGSALLAGVALVATSLVTTPVTATADGNGNALDEAEHDEPGTYALDVTSYDDAIEAIADKPGVEQIPLADLMAARTAETVACGEDCRQWPDHLNDHDRWYPQGLAGSEEANWAAAPETELVVSAWYERTSPDDHTAVNSALKFVATDDWKYRNVPLRLPVEKGGEWTTRPLASHNGGVAWAGPYLYVAATDRLHRFDTRDIMRDQEGVFLVPDRTYVAVDKEPYGTARLSSVSTDWTGEPALVSAQYNADAVTTQVIRWPLDADGDLPAEAGTVGSQHNFWIDKDSSIRKVQGVESHEGLYYFSTSGGQLERARVGTQDDRARTDWGRDADGTHIPEDLYAVPGQDMFGQTEVPSERRLFWRPMEELLP